METLVLMGSVLAAAEAPVGLTLAPQVLVGHILPQMVEVMVALEV